MVPAVAPQLLCLVQQICRELSGDPHFALPYWDWTHEHGHDHHHHDKVHGDAVELVAVSVESY
jgi:hypothetical protein